MLAAAYLFPRSDEEGSSMQRKRASSNSVSLVCMRSSWWSRAKAPAVPVQGIFASSMASFCSRSFGVARLYLCAWSKMPGRGYIIKRLSLLKTSTRNHAADTVPLESERALSPLSLSAACCVHSRSRSRVTDEPDLIYFCTVDGSFRRAQQSR